MLHAVLALTSFVLSASLCWPLNKLCLRPWRQSAGRHWTERARQLHLGDSFARTNMILLPIDLALVTILVLPGDNFLFVIIPGQLGALFAYYAICQEVAPWLSFRSWIEQIVASLVIVAVLGIAIGVGYYLMPETLGWDCMPVVAAVLIFIVFYQQWLAIALRHWLGLIAPASADLQKLVAEVSAQMGVPVRAVWESNSPQVNAWAYISSRRLIFTRRLLDHLPDEEIRAICAHELGHLNEPGGAFWRPAMLCLMVLPLILIKPLANEFGSWGLFAVVLATLVIARVRMYFARKMEVHADRLAGENTSEPVIYARALAHIYELNQSPAVISEKNWRIHPNLYDRMVSVGIAPDFPRPAAPPRRFWMTKVISTVTLLLVIVLLVKFFAKIWKDVWLN